MDNRLKRCGGGNLREAAEWADFCFGEAGAEVDDGFFAIALCLGCHAASTYEDEVGDVVRDGVRPSWFAQSHVQIDDFVSGGTVAGFKVEGLGAIEAAPECDKGNFHLLRLTNNNAPKAHDETAKPDSLVQTRLRMAWSAPKSFRCSRTMRPAGRPWRRSREQPQPREMRRLLSERFSFSFVCFFLWVSNSIA